MVSSNRFNVIKGDQPSHGGDRKTVGSEDFNLTKVILM
jgi:hypothetical protein